MKISRKLLIDFGWKAVALVAGIILFEIFIMWMYFVVMVGIPE